MTEAVNNIEREKNIRFRENLELINDIIKPETDLEIEIVSNVEFIEGAMHGKSRSGHPEGAVIYHIREVLANVDKYYGNDPDRAALRLISIIHDTFKYKVDQNKPKSGDNHHGFLAMEFSMKYDIGYLSKKVIEKHDDAYNAYSKGSRRNDWAGAETRAKNLIRFLAYKPSMLSLYLKFYRCDNNTGNKSQNDYNWFMNIVLTMADSDSSYNIK